MKTLIIAEKSSVAKKIIQALCPNAKWSVGYAENNDYIVTMCVGHLLTLKTPEEMDENLSSWTLNNLPFNFDTIDLKIKENTKDQLNVVLKLLKRTDIDEVINACDPDREGELIFRNVYYYSKCKCKNVTRMWIESVASKEALEDSYNNRKNGQLYDNLYNAAISRQYADYHIGLNATRGMTAKYNSKSPLSVGRVQTPTLRIIVDLERQIQNFKSIPFWKIVAHTSESVDGHYIDASLTDNRFEDKSVCQSVIDKTGLGPATVTDVVVSKRKNKPRKLYNLSDLQIEMNKRYKYSAQTVLDICQALYEKHGLTTYPRTSENRVSPEFAGKQELIVNGLPSIFNKQKNIIKVNKYKLNADSIAKKDIGSHEALTPVPEEKINDSKINDLSEAELNVYKAIVERFLSNFYPDAIYEKQEITFTRNGSTFKNEIENLIYPGHFEAYEAFKGKEQQELLNFKKGDTLNINELEMVEGQTQPPSRFTEASLIKMMIAPMKYVSSKEDKNILSETEGLGTEATRASIIEELKRREYIKVESQKIYPTEKGFNLIDSIPSEIMKSVPLTCLFEKKLSLISKGDYNKEVFLSEINKIIDEFINNLRSVSVAVEFNNNEKKEKTQICSCPVCGNDILEGKFGFYCSNKECNVKLNYEAAKYYGHKKITASQAKELLTKNKTKKVVKLYSSAKQKSYEAHLVYTYDANNQYPNKITIEFPKKD